MMLVDKKYFAERPDLTDAERDELIRARVNARYEAVKHAATQYQIRKERILKLKSMSTYMFGRFHLRVPRFNEDLFSVAPLPQSFAEPYSQSKAGVVRVVDRKYGQRLEGDMIPRRDIQVAKEGHARKEKKSVVVQKAGKAVGFLRTSVVDPFGGRIIEGLDEGGHVLSEGGGRLLGQGGRLLGQGGRFLGQGARLLGENVNVPFMGHNAMRNGSAIANHDDESKATMESTSISSSAKATKFD
jgi:hypothetical protein